MNPQTHKDFVPWVFNQTFDVKGGGRNRIGRREKWPKKRWEEGEIGSECRERAIYSRSCSSPISRDTGTRLRNLRPEKFNFHNTSQTELTFVWRKHQIYVYWHESIWWGRGDDRSPQRRPSKSDRDWMKLSPSTMIIEVGGVLDDHYTSLTPHPLPSPGGCCLALTSFSTTELRLF